MATSDGLNFHRLYGMAGVLYSILHTCIVNQFHPVMN